MAGERLEFGDSAFDTVFSIGGALHHMSDPVSGLREMVRVARQRVLVADWDRESAMWMNPHTEEELSASKELVVPGGQGDGVQDRGIRDVLHPLP
ncbi:methyltransferase domain-containing protein [Thermogymnomonas acidicola]|uniref:class I SAM-dependent methyltransferase n=1 Tax=Thermogymnomonas acidicola TaxID=399579 RepID=UPI0009465E48|nr:methyltransferase domain-containing protein [Thermogymnomonas acidicola]